MPTLSRPGVSKERRRAIFSMIPSCGTALYYVIQDRLQATLSPLSCSNLGVRNANMRTSTRLAAAKENSSILRGFTTSLTACNGDIKEYLRHNERLLVACVFRLASQPHTDHPHCCYDVLISILWCCCCLIATIAVADVH